MELRKKSILIALAIGDGCIRENKSTVKGKTYKYAVLEVGHTSPQKEYCEWKANLCRSVTGRKCNVTTKKVPSRIINKKYPNNVSPETIAYRFTCTHKYYKVLRKWLYPNGKKKLSSKYLKYLDELGLAIWYMDDGSTYVRKDESAFNCEIATYIPKEDAEDLITMFQNKWNIKFNLHHVGNNQYNIRTCSHEGAKFIKLIYPFVPQCMAYKLKIPERFFHERMASESDEDVF